MAAMAKPPKQQTQSLLGEIQPSSWEVSIAHSKDCSQYFQRRIEMNENHVAKQNFEEPCTVVPQARICGSTGGVIPGATRQIWNPVDGLVDCPALWCC